MKIVAFIPARYHSTRFPGKPLALIAGKPMIRHVYERAVSSSGLCEVCVATDDERILACVRGFGGRAVMTEKSHRSGTDRICEAAQKMGLHDDDLVVNIQGDQPIFDPSVISRLVKPFRDEMSIQMTTLKCRIRDERHALNQNHVKVVTDNRGFAVYFSRHSIPFYRDAGSSRTYYKHLGFYGFRMGFLMEFTRLPVGVLESAESLEQLRALEHGFRIRVVETPFDSTEVDVPEDIVTVEEILRG